MMDDRVSLGSPISTEPKTAPSTDADEAQYVPPSFAKKVMKRLRRALRRSGLVRVSEEERLEALVGPAGIWQESRDFQIQFLTAHGLKPEHSLLDLGCGVLRGGIPLIRYLDPGRFMGVDVSEGSIDEGRKLIEKEGLGGKSPDVLVSSTFGRDELGDRTFDYIWAFQLFYHLTDDLLEECFAQVRRRMHARSHFYADVNTFSPPSRWRGFPFQQKPVGFYEQVAARHGLAVEDLGQLRDHGYTRKVPGQFNPMLLFTRLHG